MEFVTNGVSVKYFRVQVIFSRIDLKNHPFCVICRGQARAVVCVHKITGVSLYLSSKTDNLFKIDEKKILHCKLFVKIVDMRVFSGRVENF